MVVNLITISCTLIAWTIVGVRCWRQMFTESGSYWLLLGTLTGIAATHGALPWLYSQEDRFGFIVAATGFASMFLSMCFVRLQSGSWEDEHGSTILTLLGSLGCSLVIMLLFSSQVLTPTEISVLVALLVGLASFAVIQYRPGVAGQET